MIGSTATSALRIVFTLIVGVFILVLECKSQERCASAEMLSRMPPAWIDFLPGGSRFESHLAHAKVGSRTTDDDTGIYKVPVVVHIVHSAQDALGVGTNISEDFVRSQIRILNEDYRRLAGTNGHNTNPEGADSRIEFFLATCDSTGQFTTGITRRPGRPGPWSLGEDSALKGPDLWPVNKYLNIWVCDVESPYLGYSTFPTVTGIPGGVMPGNYIDGVVIDYTAFGLRNSGNFNLGRTATHEIGHYLGLIHVWGDQGGCVGDDFCDDTPLQEGQINFCPTVVNNCPGQPRPMIENYLQYTYDRCMNVFTNDQVYRMRYVLRNSSRRQLRDTSRTCTTANNPVETAKVTAYYSQQKASFIIVDKSVDTTQPALIKLYSVDGRLIQEYTGTSRNLRLGPISLAKGLYLLTFKRGQTYQTIKLVNF